MNAYLDSSVILRVVLGQPGRWKEWPSVTLGVGSGLVEVECLRTLDRLRSEGALPDEELALRRETVYRLLEEMELVEPTTRSSRSVVLRVRAGIQRRIRSVCLS
jgi:hypothetical protein